MSSSTTAMASRIRTSVCGWRSTWPKGSGISCRSFVAVRTDEDRRRAGNLDAVRAPQVKAIGMAVHMIRRRHVQLHGRLIGLEEQPLDVLHLGPIWAAGVPAHRHMVPALTRRSDHAHFRPICRRRDCEYACPMVTSATEECDDGAAGISVHVEQPKVSHALDAPDGEFAAPVMAALTGHDATRSGAAGYCARAETYSSSSRACA